MNRIIYTLILFGFYIADMNAQSINLDTIYKPFKVPKGIYYSFEELKSKQPKEVLDFKIVKRSRKDIGYSSI